MQFYQRFAAMRRWMDSHAMVGGTASVGLFAIAFAIRYVLDDDLPAGFPYLTFFPAIVIAAFVLGTAAGVLCAVLSFFSAWYFFLPPFYSFTLTGQTGLALAFFILIVVVDILVIDRMVGALDDLGVSRAQALELAAQRDALFKELQHRVGNNLNMISAMLSIQSRALSDEGARQALGEAARRIGLVADINRMFHDPAHSDGKLDNAFVQKLAVKCLEAAGLRQSTSLSTDIDALVFKQDEFLPLALTLAECINNAIEHGIGEAQDAFLRISMHHQQDEVVLSVENNGKPLEEGFDASRPGSIGLMLVQAFARQLKGQFTILGGSTTRSVLRFPLELAASAPPPTSCPDASALPRPA